MSADRNGTTSDETCQWNDNGNRTDSAFTPCVNNRLTSDDTYSYVYDKEGNVVKRTKINGPTPTARRHVSSLGTTATGW
jgi:hypothetical protein